jgi:hypothetical protein
MFIALLALLLLLLRNAEQCCCSWTRRFSWGAVNRASRGRAWKPVLQTPHGHAWAALTCSMCMSRPSSEEPSTWSCTLGRACKFRRHSMPVAVDVHCKPARCCLSRQPNTDMVDISFCKMQCQARDVHCKLPAGSH